uniref:Ankyrin repeat and SOCS box containing 7 n=1 Tax=Sus scrofa TaxID=9823 RepID=A0A8D0P7H0_PIG
MLHHHCRRNPELQEELQIQAAVAAGDVHTVRKMLEQGYSPNGRDANGWTLLHFSAARGKERCVRVFLEHGGECTRMLLLKFPLLELLKQTGLVQAPLNIVAVMTPYLLTLSLKK